MILIQNNINISKHKDRYKLYNDGDEAEAVKYFKSESKKLNVFSGPLVESPLEPGMLYFFEVGDIKLEMIKLEAEGEKQE